MDRPDYRNLPPVDEPPPTPERLSMSLLRHGNACLRSAYLYLRHGGGAPSPELVRGSAGHAVFEAMTWEAIKQDESQVDSDTALAVAAHEMERFPLRAQDRDDVREMAFHMSRRSTPDGREVVGYAIDPAKVVSVERKFVIPVGDWMVSCKLDIAAIGGTVGMVDDFKTGFGYPTQEEVEQDFQLRTYAVALVKGHPVHEKRCEACVGTGKERMLAVGRDGPHGFHEAPCPDCEGRGYVEELEPPMGGHLTAVRLGQVFPMLLDRDSGEVLQRRHVISRLQVETDFEDLAALVRRFDAALRSGEFPAIKGDHCSTCPCPVECPLPEALRNHAGTINSPGEAAEAAEWLEVEKARVAAVQKELRNVVKAWGPVRYGRDRELVLELEESYSTDQDALAEGVSRAVVFGEPFDLADVRKPRRSTRLKVRTLSEAELRTEGETI